MANRIDDGYVPGGNKLQDDTAQFRFESLDQPAPELNRPLLDGPGRSAVQQHQRLAERRAPARRGIIWFAQSWSCALRLAKAPETLSPECVCLRPVHAQSRLARRAGETEAPGKAVCKSARELRGSPILTGI